MTMKSVYSRRSPVRARWEKDQCRLAKYEMVVATVAEITFDVVGPSPRRKCSRLNRPTPTTPKAEISLASTCQGVLSRSSRGTAAVYVPFPRYPVGRPGGCPPPRG